MWLTALRASIASPKTPTVGNATRFSDNASAKLDKAAFKLDNLLTQTQQAQLDLEQAAIQQQEAKETYEKLLEQEIANTDKSTHSLAMVPTISIDKIMVGQFPKIELGSAAKFFESDPEAMQRFEETQTAIAAHMQEAIT